MTAQQPSPLRNLPEYERPPVTETSLGVEFATLEGWSTPHFGLYWAGIKDRFPKFEVHPPLMPGRDPAWIATAPELRIASFPEVRCVFTDESETQLVQVQSDRFLLNWRKKKGTETYPRYESVRDQFRVEWSSFLRFLDSVGLERPSVTRSDISYFNHFAQGEEWKTLADLPRLLAPWSGDTSIKFLPVPETVLLNVSYRMPDDGRLHVVLQPAIRHSDRKQILQLSLSARGRPQRNDIDAVLEKFELGREWIVKGFTDFTAASAHEMWGRTV